MCIQILFLLPLSYVLLDCEYSDLDCEYDDVDYGYGDVDNVKQMNCLKMKNHQKCLLGRLRTSGATLLEQQQPIDICRTNKKS